MTSDERLMERVQGGDRAAFAALHARWEGPLWAFLLRRLGQRQVAEECFQEVWVRLWRSRQRYDPSRPFRPWVYTIAANVGRSRRVRTEPEAFLPLERSGDQVAARQQLVRVLDSLGEPDRTVMLLTAEGFTSYEIAEMIDTTDNAIRARQKRVRKRLRLAFNEGR